MDDDLLVIERINDTMSLCVSSLSKRIVDEADVATLGSHKGLFVYEVHEGIAGGINILAKVASLEAAFRLADIIRRMRGAPALEAT